MKVDGLGVILAIILLPIILVVTYYIQLQVDTIAKENTYNTKLLNATYDAMSAFEINTANEELSTVADSMRSMILASNNVFLNSLATNLGISNASKEHLQQYIPAVLYTMYDGYYIYAPTEVEQVAEKVKVDESLDNTDNSLITTTQGYLSVGDKGVTHSGGNEYKYKLGSSGEAEGNPTYKDNDYSDYGDILYKKKGMVEGYYKYKPDGEYEVTSDRVDADKQVDYILKSYVQYSARYVYPDLISPTIDVTINYTLDNYLNIVGTIGDVYYTKTGYLIKDGMVTVASATTVDGQTLSLLNNYNEDEARDKILGVKTNSDVTTVAAVEEASIEVNGVQIAATWSNIIDGFSVIDTRNPIVNNNKQTSYQNIQTISEAETNLKMAYEDYRNSNNDFEMLSAIQNIEYEIANYKAIAYYVSSSIFSNWVYTNLGSLTYGNIEDSVMKAYYNTEDANGNKFYNATSKADDFYYDFSNSAVSGRFIFKKDANEYEDPEKTDSNFNTHKLEVIKNSIKYNLNLSISAYSKMKGSKDFSLPILLDEEWDKILQNISIVSFMQGFDCGLKIYNNYEIVSSTNNELTVTPSEIYYVKKDEFNNQDGTFHRIDCPDLEDVTEYISFKSKEVKYDQIYDAREDKRYYDHRNLACYRCINTNNYSEERCILRDADNKEKIFSSYYEMINLLTKTKDDRQGDGAKSDNKKRAAYISIAKERQNIYKTNALPVSEGYEIYDGNKIIVNSPLKVTVSPIDLTNIKELQITMKVIKNTPPANINRLETLNLKISGGTGQATKDILLNQSTEQTFSINISDWTGNSITIEPNEALPAGYEINYTVESVKAIYK